MKKFFISLLIIPCSFIISFSQKQITLEDIWQKNTFGVKRIQEIRSMNNGTQYTTLGHNANEQFIVLYNYSDGKATDTILKNTWLRPTNPIEIDDYEFSNDENNKKMLIASETESIYRHSRASIYYVWNRRFRTLTQISKTKISLAQFSPDGYKVGFVRDNNLFIYDLATNKEVQITTDGKINNIINGSTDWVYEEEFSFDKAWFWSPDGSKIAYYRFDESNVKEFSMNKYGTLYPTEYKFKYPKAGEENSKVDIYIYDVKAGSKSKVDLGNNYEYIPRIKWTTNSNSLSIQRMNRLQNKLELLFADASTGKTKNILAETSDTYLEINDNLTFLANGNEFIWSSEKDGFNHLYLYNMEGKLVRQITKGNWDIKEFLGYNEKTGNIFYTSTKNSPTEKTLLSNNLNGSDEKQLYPTAGTDDAEFSSNYSYYILTHSDANHPPTFSIYNSDGKLVHTLEDNSSLQKTLKEYSLTTKEFFKFKTSEGTELNGWMMKPTNFDANKKYPVLMYVYGGPGINTVNNMWDRDYLWYQMLCEKGYVIVSVDNRGTGGRGKKFRDCTYKQLGKSETVDQIEAAKYLGNLPYVDKNRIGIWGWSYGGYMSSLCIFKGADVFKMAMAVAPVTNWRYYDNIYTERYMTLPKDNASGYDDNSPINFVDKLKGKFLLVHGTADDNVHFQNSMEMVNALVKANKQFRFFAYPDKNHSIYGGNTRLHLYTMLTDFVIENL